MVLTRGTAHALWISDGAVHRQHTKDLPQAESGSEESDRPTLLAISSDMLG